MSRDIPSIRAAALALCLLGGGALAGCATAEGLADRAADRAAADAERRAEDRVDRTVDQALDAAEDAVVCLVTDEECIRRARDDGREVVVTDEEGDVVEVIEPAAAPAATPAGPTESDGSGLRPGEGAWANYDFVPGERVIFAEDFAGERVGDFPRRLEFMRGNMEVVEWEGAPYLRATDGNGRFAVVLPEALPRRFTVEFDFAGGRAASTLAFSEGADTQVLFYYTVGGLRGAVDARSNLSAPDRDRFQTVRVMADGDHVKVYMDGRRVANVPNADLRRSDRLVFNLAAGSSTPVLLTDLRVAASGRSLYEALSAEGRTATHGILFDTGSDRIRPESTPTLEEIAGMLREHPGLRLGIEGHTDSTGSAEANQALSERRARAVRAFLVEHGGIAADRLEAAGYGESRPAASNDTPEGRQTNRRVELVRL